VLILDAAHKLVALAAIIPLQAQAQRGLRIDQVGHLAVIFERLVAARNRRVTVLADRDKRRGDVKLDDSAARGTVCDLHGRSSLSVQGTLLGSGSPRGIERATTCVAPSRVVRNFSQSQAGRRRQQ